MDHDAQDPLAPILAGEGIVASERVNQKNNAVYPVVAVRTRWMDDQLKSLFAKDPTFSQVRRPGLFKTAQHM